MKALRCAERLPDDASIDAIVAAMIQDGDLRVVGFDENGEPIVAVDDREK